MQVPIDGSQRDFLDQKNPRRAMAFAYKIATTSSYNIIEIINY